MALEPLDSGSIQSPSKIYRDSITTGSSAPTSSFLASAFAGSSRGECRCCTGFIGQHSYLYQPTLDLSNLGRIIMGLPNTGVGQGSSHASSTASFHGTIADVEMRRIYRSGASKTISLIPGGREATGERQLGGDLPQHDRRCLPWHRPRRARGLAPEAKAFVPTTKNETRTARGDSSHVAVTTKRTPCLKRSTAEGKG